MILQGQSSTPNNTPLLVAFATDASGSQRVGVTPILALFLVGLVLMVWVRADGAEARRRQT